MYRKESEKADCHSISREHSKKRPRDIINVIDHLFCLYAQTWAIKEGLHIASLALQQLFPKIKNPSFSQLLAKQQDFFIARAFNDMEHSRYTVVEEFFDFLKTEQQIPEQWIPKPESTVIEALDKLNRRALRLTNSDN